MKLFFITLFFLTVSCKDCYDIQVPYYEEEPYEAIEEETRSLTYEDAKASIGRIDGLALFGKNPKIFIDVILRNTDEKGGSFNIIANVSSQGNKITIEGSQYIESGELAEFRIEKEVNPFTFETNTDFTWEITAPSLTFQKKVTKYRTITKFRSCNTCEENCK